MAQTPGAGTGDSVGQFRRYRCATLFNYNCNLSLCGTFLQYLLPLPHNCRLLPTPKETYDLNLIVVTLIISSFRIPTSIFCTKELYNLGLLPCPRLSSKLFYILKTKKSGNECLLWRQVCIQIVSYLEHQKKWYYCLLLNANFRTVGFGTDLWDDCDASISHYSNPTAQAVELRHCCFVCLFLLACLFVCCYKTLQFLLGLPPWARSKTPGSISTRAAAVALNFSSTTRVQPAEL